MLVRGHVTLEETRSNFSPISDDVASQPHKTDSSDRYHLPNECPFNIISIAMQSFKLSVIVLEAPVQFKFLLEISDAVKWCSMVDLAKAVKHAGTDE